MLIGPPVPEIQLSKVQSHNVNLTSYGLTSLWFRVNWPSHSWEKHFQNLTLKIQGQGHSSRSQSRYNTLLTQIPFFYVDWPSHSWYTAISKFDIENSRSRSWVRSKLKVTTWVQHSVLTSLSFHVNPASHSWVMTFSKFDLENQGSRSWVRSKLTNIRIFPGAF